MSAGSLLITDGTIVAAVLSHKHNTFTATGQRRIDNMLWQYVTALMVDNTTHEITPYTENVSKIHELLENFTKLVYTDFTNNQ